MVLPTVLEIHSSKLAMEVPSKERALAWVRILGVHRVGGRPRAALQHFAHLRQEEFCRTPVAVAERKDVCLLMGS